VTWFWNDALTSTLDTHKDYTITARLIALRSTAKERAHKRAPVKISKVVFIRYVQELGVKRPGWLCGDDRGRLGGVFIGTAVPEKVSVIE
jgi:hypothetical protein